MNDETKQRIRRILTARDQQHDATERIVRCIEEAVIVADNDLENGQISDVRMRLGEARQEATRRRDKTLWEVLAARETIRELFDLQIQFTSEGSRDPLKELLGE